MTTEEVRMLPGRSSAHYDRLLVAPLCLAAAGFAWGALARRFFEFREGEAMQVITTLIFVVGLVAIFPTLVIGWLYLRRRAAEDRAGYTVAYGYRRDLPQLDPLTGEVVRAAREPFLTAAQRRKQLAKR